MAQHSGGSARIRAVRRDGEQVTPLELFFDLVFVLALTQCTTVIVDRPTWAGVGQGLLVLGLLWWAWVGYAWLTSVVDPEEGAVRLVMFVAMAAFLVAALAVPEAFGDDAHGLRGRVRRRARRRTSRCSCWPAGTSPSSGTRSGAWRSAPRSRSGCSWPARSTSGGAREVLWAVALVLDMAWPVLLRRRRAGSSSRRHFAERHGLIIIIALGESVIAIGVGAGVDADRRGDRRRRARRVSGGVPVVGLLRRRVDRRARGASPRCHRDASATRSRATRIPSSTSRWWPGSCSPRSRSRPR